MPTITLQTHINARPAVCFDLSRSIDLHMISTAHTGEQAIAGKTSGLIENGETVTWHAKHFGLWQKLTVKIVAFDPPVFFADELVSGAFRSFRHEHHFKQEGEGTLMTDIFTFVSPLGILGRIANKVFLTGYMTGLLLKRNATIKTFAESGKWQEIF